jgi:hypothetical protein
MARDFTEPLAIFPALVEILRWGALQGPNYVLITYLIDGETEGLI